MKPLDQIRSAAELDDLPPESIVKTQDGSIACRHYDHIHGVVFGDDRPFRWDALVAPAVLLWHPDWKEQTQKRLDELAETIALEEIAEAQRVNESAEFTDGL